MEKINTDFFTDNQKERWSKRVDLLTRGYLGFIAVYWVLLVISFLALPYFGGFVKASTHYVGAVIFAPHLLIAASTNIVWAHETLGTAREDSGFSPKTILKGAFGMGGFAVICLLVGFGILPLAPPSLYSIWLYLLGGVEYLTIVVPVILTTILLTDNPRASIKASLKVPLSWLVYPCVLAIFGPVLLYCTYFSVVYPLASILLALPIATLLPLVIMMFPYFVAYHNHTAEINTKETGN